MAKIAKNSTQDSCKANLEFKFVKVFLTVNVWKKSNQQKARCCRDSFALLKEIKGIACDNLLSMFSRSFSFNEKM